jgi:hypothetical protein
MKLLRTWATLLLPAVAIRGPGYSVRTDKRPVVSDGLRLEVR